MNWAQTAGWFARWTSPIGPAFLEAIDEFAAATGGMLDLLFNNAGIDAKGRFEAMAWEKVVAVVNVNLLAGLSLIHAAVPLLKATKAALCLSTSSASAIFGTADLAVYSATKHAVKGLTEALAVEFADHGVRAADILPGIIDTAMLPDGQKARLPKKGMFRVLPAEGDRGYGVGGLSRRQGSLVRPVRARGL